MSMLSALARSHMGRALLEFMKDNELPEDWEDPQRYSITAYATGRVLDNKLGSSVICDGDMNDEILVHLDSPKGKCVVNLNTLLALGCAFIEDQYRKAGEAIDQESKLLQEDSKSGDGHDQQRHTGLP